MRRRVIYLLLGLSVCALGAYAWIRLNAPPPGIQSKGGSESMVAEYVSLGTAVVSFLTAVVGLIRTGRDRRSSG
jgi:hypothetical protein